MHPTSLSVCEIQCQTSFLPSFLPHAIISRPQKAAVSFSPLWNLNFMSIWANSLKPYQLIFIWALLKPWFCFNPKFTSIWGHSLNPNYLILGASRLLLPVLGRSSTLCLERTLLPGHDVEGRMEMEDEVLYSQKPMSLWSIVIEGSVTRWLALSVSWCRSHVAILQDPVAPSWVETVVIEEDLLQL